MENDRMPAVGFVYNRKKTATRSKAAVIEILVSYCGKHKYMSTGVRVLPKEWHCGMVTGRPDAIELNKALNTMRNKVLKAINEMLEEGLVDIREIPSRMRRQEAMGKTFTEFCRERAKVRTYGMAKGTVARYERFLRWFERWGVMRCFCDVTERNVMLMDEALSRTGMRDVSKWTNYHRTLKSFILDAISEGYLRRNPYKWVRISKGDDDGKGLRKYLTREELERIRTARMGTECLERVRDLFVFQTYTCMSYTDLVAFDAGKVREVNGRKMYTGRRGKTGVEFTFMLLEPALEVLARYGGKLPLLSNVKYNEYLKVVAQAAGIDKSITTHWARHTGATLLLNAGVDMETVAKILGHTSTKITRSVYAKLLDDTVAREMEKALPLAPPPHRGGD